jgi:glutamate-ammonia-ligase adenylyltransferase
MNAPHLPVNTLSLPVASRLGDAERALENFAGYLASDAVIASPSSGRSNPSFIEKEKMDCHGDEAPRNDAATTDNTLNQLTPLISAMAGNSPYLARLITKYPEQLLYNHRHGCSEAWAALMRELGSLDLAASSQESLMRELRHIKARAAFTIAMADIQNEWPLLQVTQALSGFAAAAVGASLRFLLLKAAARGELQLASTEQPEATTGIIILGMGKLGAFELNYSSDIDLIVLFDYATLPYTGHKNAQHFMNKIASDLVFILQERDANGYVFRTDLRLRPDPMSTPLAVSTAAALSYYETVGQNWERAAMIKARPIAGDMPASEAFLRELIPFVWRKTLDFATIADIHSIKRQMNASKGRVVEVAGHNIKLGVGGIREIEFFVQTQQLVWGGRIPNLRVRGTLDSLRELAEQSMITPETRDYLTHSYYYLRTLEHRLQMRNDEQTHTLPSDDATLHEVSVFMGYDSVASFDAACRAVLTGVHTIYTDSMVGTAPLAVEGNLVFTGVEADAETLKTLENLGYKEAKRVSDIIQGWHRGSRKSTRSKRSRQVLTELIPALLTALSKTANPDSAFFHFDDFIGHLPSGAQIFSLFHTRPEMLSLLADILGSAPALGQTLSNDPSLLDGVLEADFFLGLPSKEDLENTVAERLRYTHDYEQKMVFLRIFNNEKRFQAGVFLLKRLGSPRRIGAFLSDVAEVILQSTMQEVWAEYEASRSQRAEVRKIDVDQTGSVVPPPLRGRLGGGASDRSQHSIQPPSQPSPQGGGLTRIEADASFYNTPFAVLALGKLGGREMTFGSDLDIIFLYDDLGDDASDARMHLARIAQRLVSALTLLTREGRLYEVDTRLRPGGSDGPLATSLTAFDNYFDKTAWTYEFMAISRARVAATNNPDFAERVEETVKKHIIRKRDSAKLLADVVDMRERIAKEFSTQNSWALKHVRGGMVDLDFIAQYLLLRHAHTIPNILNRNARAVFEVALTEKILPEETAQQLITAKKFMSDLMSLQRLSAPGGAITDDAPIGLKRLLTRGMRMKPFSALKNHLFEQQTIVSAIFQRMRHGDL